MYFIWYICFELHTASHQPSRFCKTAFIHMKFVVQISHNSNHTNVEYALLP